MNTEPFDYTVDGTEFSGMLVWNGAASSPRPAVLMAPDWMGIGAGAIEMAKSIAGGRFCVAIADLYGKGIRPQSMEQAAALANPIKADVPLQRVRARGALDAARAVTSERGLAKAGAPMGAVGFCFGGTNVLELARMGADLAVVISVHGELLTPSPARADTLKSKIVIIHGSADPVAPKGQRDAIEAEMTEARAQWWEVVFGGAVHSFTNPHAAVPNVSMYDAKAARWSARIIEQTLVDELVG